ncbi:MAG TPA: hypothetical protein DD725_04345 [Deltaproteobacteria bacterium]|nr:hypothetical protein [Deltaproteobacteria bacterium]
MIDKKEILSHTDIPEQAIEKWRRMLRAMFRAYRQKEPEDKRSDWELLTSLMNHFYESGLIRKSKDGRFILPDIDGVIPRRIKL